MADENEQGYRSEEFIVSAMSRWGGAVFKLAFAQTTSRADAEDIYQEAFIRLFKDTTQFNDDDHVKAWLLRVTANCCHDLARSGWRRKATVVEQPDLRTDEIEAASTEAMQDLAEALEALSEENRTIVHLFYYEGYSGADIAAILDLNASTVRTRLERARKEMKSFLGGRDNG